MNTPILRSLAARSWLGGICSLLCAVAPVALMAQTDDFNDGNDVGWNRYSPLTPFGVPGVFSFPNGGYRIQTTTPSPNPGSLGPGRAGSLRPENYTNFFVSIDIVDWNDSLPQASGILEIGRAHV